MPKSTNTVKRKPGRPKTGASRMYGARLPEDLVAAIDAWAAVNGVKRSEAIRRLVEMALKAKQPRQ